MITTFNTRTANSFSGVAFFPLRKAAAGGGVTTLNVSGALASAGALAWQPTKPLAGLLDLSGAFGPLTASQSLVSTLPMTGSLLTQRQQTLTFSGALGLLGTLASAPVKLLASAAGGVGALRYQVSKALAGVIASVSTVTASPQIRQFAGTLGLSGTAQQIRSQLLTVSGTVPMAGALTWLLSISTAGVVASAGTLQKGVSQLFTALLGSFGELAMNPTLSFTGTVPSSSDVELTQGQAIELAGTLLSTGSMQRRPALDLPGSLGLDGLLHFQPILENQGSLGSEGTLNVGTDLQVTGQIGLEGDLIMTGDLAIDVGGTVPMAGSTLMARLLETSGSIVGAHALAVVVIPFKILQAILQFEGRVDTSFTKSMTGTLSLSGALTRAMSRRVSGGLAPVGAAYQQAQVSMAGVVSFTSDVVFVGVEIVAMSGIVTPAGLLVAMPVLQRLFTGVIGVTGALILTPAILIRHGTIKLVNAILRFAGLKSPKLTGRGTVKDPALGDHSTLDDSELR